MRADFSGYATKADLLCTDGRVIKPGAFQHHDGARVPLVWQHQQNDPTNVLGHAVLEARDDGIYAYGYFNETPSGLHAKEMVKHGDISSLSIHANQLKQKGRDVLHGNITELSLVLAGANAGAVIDNLFHMKDGDFEELEDEALIFTGLTLEHQDKEGEKVADEEVTVEDAYKSMTPEQQAAVAIIVEEAVDKALDDFEEELDKAQSTQPPAVEEGDNIQHSQEGAPVSRNVFDQSGATTQDKATLTHSQLETIMATAKKTGSYKEAFLTHAVEYGIDNIDILFPDAKAVSNTPEFVKRRTAWVDKVLGGAKHPPYARIKTLFADITADEARAKGYVKGNMKKEEFFGLTKRVTGPQTVYKKQKLDRDDIIDITDLEVVAWLKTEMRLMLEEEIARAVLIGDGREVDDEDKIKDPAGSSDGSGIRSIAHDHEFYAHKVTLATNASPDDAIEAIIRSQENYHGSGSPTMFVSKSFLTDMLLLKDKMGRRLYRNNSELASELQVGDIVDVEILNEVPEVLAIIVNMQDYSIGTDKGGETNFFDDFDIDYNQYKYLYEARLSGALTRWKSALVITRTAGTLATPTVPTFDDETGVVTIPTVTGVVYKNAETDATLTAGAQTALDLDDVLEVEAVPAAGYYFPYNFDADWTYTGVTEL